MNRRIWLHSMEFLNAKKTLLAGFTTVRNVGAANYADVALKAINRGDSLGTKDVCFLGHL